MKLPEVKQAERYVGLYVVDFGDHCGVGFTAQEVSELLDSEKFGGCKVYKIHRAAPDGGLELRGIRRQIFQLESGMLFHAYDEPTARREYKALVKLAVKAAPPSRAKIQLARYSPDRYVTAIIYPAEMEDKFARWLADGNYITSAAAEGGTEVVSRYYQQQVEILEKHQLWGVDSWGSRTGDELLKAVGMAVVR